MASRLSLAAKLLLQTITMELTLQCATRRGFCEICLLTLGACARATVLALSLTLGKCAKVTVLALSLTLGACARLAPSLFILSVHRAAEISDHFYALVR